MSIPDRAKGMPENIWKHVVDFLMGPMRREQARRDCQGRELYIWSRAAKLARLSKIASQQDPINTTVLEYTSREVIRYMDELKKLNNPG